MAKKKETPEVEAPEVKENENPCTKLLKEVQEKEYSNVLILGITPDGLMDINTAYPNFGNVHHLLNRAGVEVVLMEKSQMSRPPVEEVTQSE